MGKFFLGVAAGVAFCGLVVLIVAFALVRLGSRRPVVPNESTLVMNLEGEVPEKAPPELPFPFLENHNRVTVSDVWLNLRKAAADRRIRAVLFQPRGLSIGWAKLEEIHADLERFRKSSKPLVAFLRNPGLREYYLATAADRVYMTPEDSLDVKGLRLESIYLKDALDKLGLKMDVIHAGKYKDAGDMFVRTSMSPETREVLNQVLDRYYSDLVNTIAAGRRKQPDQVRALIDQGPFSGAQALAAGLVDELAFGDKVEDDLKRRLLESRLNKVPFKVYDRIPASSISGVEGRNRIALVVGQGVILRGSASDGLDDSGAMISGAMNKAFHELANDPNIKGVIFRVDSPGGDAIASDDMLHEARNLSGKKPLVISMSDYAASGGYFVAMTGDPIVAYPNTLTGSIGVIYNRLSLGGLFDKLGIKMDFLQRGRYAGLNSGLAPLTADEQAKLGEQVDRLYQAFLQRVATGRHRRVEEIEPLAQGRVWLGAQAKENALVNDLGGLDRAIELVKQLASIPKTEPITLVTYPPKRSLIDLLFNRSEEAPEFETIARRLFPDPEVRAALQGWMRGGMLAMPPYVVQIR